MELLDQVQDLDTVVVPVGGGGLLAGVAVAVKAKKSGVRVVAVEPENAAGFLAACLHGSPRPALLAPTLADGLAVSQVGDTSFAVAAPLVDDVVTVSEDELTRAMKGLATEERLIVEGAGAAAVASIVAGKASAPGQRVVAMVTGGNVDLPKWLFTIS